MDRSSEDGRKKSGASHDGTRLAAIEQLRRVAMAATDGGVRPAEIEKAARALVDELRQRDDAPERMLIRLKEALAQAGLVPRFPPAEAGEVGVSKDVYRDVISWAIRCYYEDGD